MVTLTKAQARKRFPKSVKQRGYICPFHMHNPDQEAVMWSCQKCIYVQDPCGCGPDDACEVCEPESFKDAKRDGYMGSGAVECRLANVENIMADRYSNRKANTRTSPQSKDVISEEHETH